MGLRETAAVSGASLLGLVALFQCLLAIGLPLGRAAWGGRHRILPTKLRIASATAIGVLALAAWMLLASADLVTPGDMLAVRVAAWALAGYFALNVAMNALSKSRIERAIMLSASILLVVSYLLVLLGRR